MENSAKFHDAALQLVSLATTSQRCSISCSNPLCKPSNCFKHCNFSDKRIYVYVCIVRGPFCLTCCSRQLLCVWPQPQHSSPAPSGSGSGEIGAETHRGKAHWQLDSSSSSIQGPSDIHICRDICQYFARRVRYVDFALGKVQRRY